MKTLVIGRSGQVARALARRAEARGIAVKTVGRPEVDLANSAAVAALVEREMPSVVINAAAYTAVDKAETEPERAFAVNAAGAEAVARAAAAIAALVIHVSTDYVFSGEGGSPYVESDPTGPTGVYGESKLDGEKRVFAANAQAIVVRTAWVFDAEGANFVRTMLRLAKTKEQVSVVDDQIGCPTFASDLADALLEIVMTLGVDRQSMGVYHCASAGEATWAEFAREIFALSEARGGPTAQVIPITTADYPTRARRPANSRLDCSKLANDYGVRLRPWRKALADCVDEIAAGGWRVE